MHDTWHDATTVELYYEDFGIRTEEAARARRGHVMVHMSCQGLLACGTVGTTFLCR